MKTLAIFLCCVAAIVAFPTTKEEQHLEFAAWKKFHGKTYSSKSEEDFRLGIWLNNMEVTYTVRLNYEIVCDLQAASRIFVFFIYQSR